MNENLSNQRRHQRRHQRHEIPLQASLQAGGIIVPCRVHNISASGALIEVHAHLRIGDCTRLNVLDFGTLAGRVVRVSSTSVGIVFEDGEEVINAFIVGWQALNSEIIAPSHPEPVDHRERQAV